MFNLDDIYPIVALVVAAFGLAALLLVSRDLRLLLAKLEAIGGVRPESRTLSSAKFILPVSRMIGQVLESIRQKIHVLSWQVDSQISTTSKVDERQIFSELRGGGLPYERIVNYVSERARAKEVVVMCGDSISELPEFHSLRPLSNRLKRALGQCFSILMSSSDSDQPDDSLVDAGIFMPFGFRQVLGRSVAFARNGKQARLVIWLGYEQDLPTDGEKVFLDEICKKLQIFISSVEDAQELRKEVTDIRTQSEERSQFLTYVSHDIRSPLNNIKAILTILKLDRTCQDYDEMVGIAVQNCDTLGDLVDGVLDVARHRAGKLTSTTKVVNLGKLVRDVFDGFKVTAKIRNLAFDFTDRTDGALVDVDARQVKRVVANLISNAIKYTKKGIVQVFVESRTSGTYSVIVKDTGIGMSKEEVDRLFTPFTRFTNQSDGIGLGLALTQILTRLNKGEVLVTSELKHGSEFEIRFNRAAGAQAAKTLPEETQSSQAIVSYKVLVYAKRASDLSTFAEVLKDFGLHPFTCQSLGDISGIHNFESVDMVLIAGASEKREISVVSGIVRGLKDRPMVGVVLEEKSPVSRDQAIISGVDVVINGDRDLKYVANDVVVALEGKINKATPAMVA